MKKHRKWGYMVDKRTVIYSVFVMIIVFFAICVLNIFTGKSEVALGYPVKVRSAQLVDKVNDLPDEDNIKIYNPSTSENSEEGNVEYISGSEPEVEIKTEVKTEEDFAEVEFSRDLYLGMVGDDVKKAQYLLKKANYYNGEINGEFDDKTKRAVILFQKDNSITQTGNIGEMTRASLEDMVNKE